MANKLELTWYGKDEPIRVEPRLLIENTALSNTAVDPDTENMLIHGDNLLALKALEPMFAGQIKCIYIEMKAPKLIQINYSSAVTPRGYIFGKRVHFAGRVSPGCFCFMEVAT